MRAAIVLLLAVIAAIAVNWVGDGWLLNQIASEMPSAAP
jgi:hypothetical protein